jgi:hypothetical protein
MDMSIDLYAYCRYLEERVRSLECRMHQLEQKAADISRELEKASERKQVHIDNVVFKIQELAVKDLSGSLNIGLSALADPEQIERWMNQATDPAGPFEANDQQPHADQGLQMENLSNENE